MELQIKHLAPYLHLRTSPLQLSTTKGNRTLEGLTGAWTVEVRSGMIVERMHLDKVRPHLKPLSSLTKEVLRNAGFSCHIDWLTNEREHWVKVYGHKGMINGLPYRHVKWLFNNHYDVFGLIDQNLAISI